MYMAYSEKNGIDCKWFGLHLLVVQCLLIPSVLVMPFHDLSYSMHVLQIQHVLSILQTCMMCTKKI